MVARNPGTSFRAVVLDANKNRKDSMAALKHPEGEKVFSPPGFHTTIFSSRFSFASRKTDKAKGELLVVYICMIQQAY